MVKLKLSYLKISHAMTIVIFVDSIKFIYFLSVIFYFDLINMMYYHNLLILIH
jgi:hypothetical protein